LYIKREPLGRGNLTFRKRRRRYPIILILIYLGILAGAVYVFLRADQLRPQVEALIGPSPVPTQSVGELVQLAEAAYYEGDLDIAAEYYRQAVELDPENVELLAELSRVLTLSYQLREALDVAEQAILIAPEDSRGHAMKARALDWMGEYDQAVVSALRAVELDSENALAHTYLAEAYNDLGRWKQAREQAELAVELDPYSIDARRNYALVLEYQGYYEGAVQQYLQALQIHPNLLDLWYGLARNYRGAGQFDMSVDTYTQIIFRTPEDPLPYVELGRTYFEIRDDDAAQEYLDQARNLVCEECPLYTGDDYLAGQVPEQRELPDYIFMPAWTRLGQVYYVRRNYEDAIGIFEEAITWGEAQDPDSDDYQPIPIEAYYTLAAAYYYVDSDSEGRPLCNTAIPMADKALEIYESRRLEDADALNNILRVYVLCRDYSNTPPTIAFSFPDGYEEPEVLIELPGTNEGEETPEE
jgi:tetratricopeptide (TPR) repeat protein